MRLFQIFLFFLMLIISAGSCATAERQSRKVKRAEAKAERVKEQQWNAVLESQRKDKKRRLSMQTPETKKRMKETQKNAKRINNRNDEPFLKRLFHRKKR